MRVKVHYMLSYIYRLVGELKVEFSYALKASTLEHTKLLVALRSA